MPRFTRTTITNLRAEIKDTNAALLASGSDYFYSEGDRNGYHALDLNRREADGKNYTVGFVDGDKSPRELIEVLTAHYEYYLGRKCRC